MLLYNGSRYVKGNVFLDSKGNKLTFDRNTKKGKIFITEKGVRIGLTENQVSRLKILKEDTYKSDYEDFKVIGIEIKFDGLEDGLLISNKSLKSIKTFNSPLGNDRIIGLIGIDIKKISLGNYTLDFLSNYNHTATIKVMLEGLDSVTYEVSFISRFVQVASDVFICVFEAIEK